MLQGYTFLEYFLSLSLAEKLIGRIDYPLSLFFAGFVSGWQPFPRPFSADAKPISFDFALRAEYSCALTAKTVISRDAVDALISALSQGALVRHHTAKCALIEPIRTKLISIVPHVVSHSVSRALKSI